MWKPRLALSDPAERGNSGSKASKPNVIQGRVRAQYAVGSGAGKKKSSAVKLLAPKLGNKILSHLDVPQCTETVLIDRCIMKPRKQETEALISCVVLNGDSMHIESLEQKTPSNKKHGQVQKVLKSPCGKLNAVVEESGQSERVTEPSLAPWQQADFNIDDILKPVAKSRGSVRRSLRNRRSVDLQAEGLVWVDHTSPEVSKASRRKTRGRLSGVSELLLSQASEEPAPGTLLNVN